jgi:dienelactone hydrolase
MKNSSLVFAVSALACASVIQVTPAAAEFKTQMVDYKQGDTALQGYLAYESAGPAKRGGILVVHHRDGLDEFTKEQTRDLAKMGFVVFAADIFGKGVLPKNVEEAQAQSGKYNKDRPTMRARAQAGLDVLRKNSMVDTSRVATLGYCFGGTVVMELAETGAPLVGTVSVHGSFRDFTPGAAKNINGRVLILHGAEDPVAPLSEVDLVVSELRKAKVDWQLELYGGAHHGFSRPANEIEARANVRSLAARERFFGETLK